MPVKLRVFLVAGLPTIGQECTLNRPGLDRTIRTRLRGFMHFTTDASGNLGDYGDSPGERKNGPRQPPAAHPLELEFPSR